MEIAKGVTADDYNSLNLALYTNDDWDKAFTYLDLRLTERYIQPADVLRAAEKDKSPADKTFGFTILAIDCMLLETIQSFYEGITDSKRKSQPLFIDFLTQRDNFKSHFTTRVDAKRFYEDFRCGILHQAQTFNNTKVWAVGSLIMKLGKTLIVNREQFHEAMKAEKDQYIGLLRNKNNHILMDNFKTKMDFIASS